MPKYYTGDDNRDALTEPDPLPCESCGAKHDEPCAPECGCKYCRAKELRERELTGAIPAQREG